MQPGDLPASRTRLLLDRRRFLIAGAGATAAVVAGCSSDGDEAGAPTTDGPTPSSTTPGTTISDTVPADTTATTAPLSAAAAALAAPGSPGLIDEEIYQQRVDEYLAFATTAEHSSTPSGINAYLGRAHREPDFTWPCLLYTSDAADEVSPV